MSSTNPLLEKDPEISNDRQNSCWGQHAHCREIDAILSFLLVSAYVTLIFARTFIDIFYSDTKGSYAFFFSTVSLVGLTVHLIPLAIWLTLCFNHKGIHSFWSWKTWVTFLMPGGFAPRYGAFILGAVLFLTSNIVSENVTPAYLVKKTRAWKSAPICRASFLSVYPMTGNFLKRFHRDDATGCFGATNYTQTAKRLRFDYLEPEESITMGKAFTFEDVYANNKWATNFIHPDSSHIPAKYKDDPKKYTDAYCYYQCITWTELAFSTLVGQLGMIFAGAAVVVKITDSCSGYIGWHLVTEDTDVKTLKHIREITSNFGWAPGCCRTLAIVCCKIFHKSRLFCAIQLLAVNFFSKWIASLIDIDGYYTVDYYVTMTLVMCLCYACMLRLWNPYSCAPMIFTRKLWEEGEDSFLDIKSSPARLAKADLFEWFHMTTQQRLHHLTMYARRVGLSDVPDQETSKPAVKDSDEERHWRESDDCCYKCFTGTLNCLKRYQSKDKGQAKDYSVVCVKRHTIHKEVHIKFFDEDLNRTRTRIFRKEVEVPYLCKGTVTGNSVDGRLKIDWQLPTGTMNMKTDLLNVAQWTPEWEAFISESDI